MNEMPMAEFDVTMKIGGTDVPATIEVYGRIHENGGSWEHGDCGRWIDVDRVVMSGVDVTAMLEWDRFRRAIYDYCFTECRRAA